MKERIFNVPADSTVEFAELFVITSYSIHYTKLYEKMPIPPAITIQSGDCLINTPVMIIAEPHSHITISKTSL